jgi:hypothetical protein
MKPFAPSQLTTTVSALITAADTRRAGVAAPTLPQPP